MVQHLKNLGTQVRSGARADNDRQAAGNARGRVDHDVETPRLGHTVHRLADLGEDGLPGLEGAILEVLAAGVPEVSDLLVQLAGGSYASLDLLLFFRRGG